MNEQFKLHVALSLSPHKNKCLHILRNRFCPYFLSFTCQFLNHMVITVLVRYEECAFYFATVRIDTLVIENFPVVIVVVEIDGTVEGHQNDLRSLESRKNWNNEMEENCLHQQFYTHLFWLQTSGNNCSIF